MNKYDFSPKSELKAIHELPDPFLKPDGTRVQTREEWPEQREYLKAMLTHYLSVMLTGETAAGQYPR